MTLTSISKTIYKQLKLLYSNEDCDFRDVVDSLVVDNLVAEDKFLVEVSSEVKMVL